jgi:hypothetical protein
MLFRLYSLLRRALYFLLGQRRFKVWVNTHPWAWFVPEGDSINLPVINEEITDAFYLSASGIQNAVAILRANFPQGKFTPTNWQSESAWNTRTFTMERFEAEGSAAFLAQIEQAHQEILLSAQSAFNQRHPDRSCHL